jgi:hypothetical protein
LCFFIKQTLGSKFSLVLTETLQTREPKSGFNVQQQPPKAPSARSPLSLLPQHPLPSKQLCNAALRAAPLLQSIRCMNKIGGVYFECLLAAVIGSLTLDDDGAGGLGLLTLQLLAR